MSTIPQPLSGNEIKIGIAARMTQGLPPDVSEPLKEQIIAGLGKTCSLLPSSAYAKFKADWTLEYARIPELVAVWWVNYSLDDFGRVTRGGIGGKTANPHNDATHIEGTIEEAPPDRFRRETDQPIPKPIELKQAEPEKSTLSKAMRGQGKRRQV